MGVLSNVYDVVELGHFEKPFKVLHLIILPFSHPQLPIPFLIKSRARTRIRPSS